MLYLCLHKISEFKNKNMKTNFNLKIFWSICFIYTLINVNGQIPNNVIPYNGIPKLIPDSLSQFLISPSFAVLTHSENPIVKSANSCAPISISSQTLGYIDHSSHRIITIEDIDSNACSSSTPNLYLTKIPNLLYWDSLAYGDPKVIQMGDHIVLTDSNASSTITYYFIPNETENILKISFAFVTQAVPYHDNEENGFFRIELTDTTGNFLTSDPMNSTFYYIPPTVTDPILHPCCHNLVNSDSCISNNITIWNDWITIPFDLNQQIGEVVRLRIIVSECVYTAHYTYCYFTGGGINGHINAQINSLDSTILISAPFGFTNYHWKINQIDRPEFDGLFQFSEYINNSDTLFTCIVNDQVGNPITLSKSVKYFEIIPDFSWEQLTDENNYKVQFSNLSTITDVTNGENQTNTEMNLLWNFGDNETSNDPNPIHYYSGFGPYQVSLTVSDPNQIFIQNIHYEVLLDELVKISEQTNFSNFKIYPNPFKETLTITNSQSSNPVLFEIHDIFGQVVLSGEFENQTEISTGKFSSGIYIVKISNGQQNYFKKVVKQ